jgi:hypothetical protein
MIAGMLKALRKKILLMNIFFVGFALIAGFTVFFAISFRQANKDMQNALRNLIATEEPLKAYSQLFGFVHTSRKMHIVLYDKTSGSMKIIAGEDDGSVRETQLIAAAKALLNEEKESGRLKRYKLYYSRVETANMIKMAFVSEETFTRLYTDSAKEAFYADILIVVISLGFVMLTSLVFYKRNLDFIEYVGASSGVS